MTTDNTQELDEILDEFLTDIYMNNEHFAANQEALDKTKEEPMQAILNWHNKQAEQIEATAYNRGEVDAKEYWQEEARKQIEAVLDRLEATKRTADLCTDDTYVVKQKFIEAERNKLNPSKSTPFNKLKEEL